MHSFFLKLYPLVIPVACETAGEKFRGHKPTKVISAENAEIDDINVIRDGDHLFLLHNECESMGCSMT
jgi:predicted CoA-binding protein